MTTLKDYSTKEMYDELQRRLSGTIKKKTWVDLETNLEWEVVTKPKMTWNDAIEYATSLGEGWRLPTITELLTLVDHSKYDHCCKTNSLKCVSSYYWSSTTYASYTSYAWYVYFYNGVVNHNYKTGNMYVRCVRGGDK